MKRLLTLFIALLMPFVTYNSDQKTLSAIQDEVAAKNKAWELLNTYTTIQKQITEMRNNLLIFHSTIERKKMEVFMKSMAELLLALDDLKPSTIITELRIRNQNLTRLIQTNKKKDLEYFRHTLLRLINDVVSETEKRRNIAAKEYNSF